MPKQNLRPGTVACDPFSGCRGCASGAAGESNIFGGKYGQRLAAIQIAREEALEAERAREEEARAADKAERKKRKKEEKRRATEAGGAGAGGLEVWARSREEEDAAARLAEDAGAEDAGAENAEARGKRARTRSEAGDAGDAAAEPGAAGAESGAAPAE